MNTTQELLHKRIRDADLRLTLPRRAICKVLAENEAGFLTATEIVEQTALDLAPIDASTVYRTLDELARIGLIHHVHFGTQPGRWHLAVEHEHIHLVCGECGKTQEVPTKKFDDLFNHLRAEYDFQADLSHFAVMGHCSSCDSSGDHAHHPQS